MPKSTLHYWARTEFIVPSISPARERLWSYADLMAIRIVDWLRRHKQLGDVAVAATPIQRIRRLLAQLEQERRELWTGDATSWQTPVRVDAKGRLILVTEAGARDLRGQQIAIETLDPFAPFETADIAGPHLVAPRPTLRIIPGRLAGEPHVHDTRISSAAIAALATRGFEPSQIAAMYSAIDVRAVDEAIDLERQLARNARQAA